MLCQLRSVRVVCLHFETTQASSADFRFDANRDEPVNLSVMVRDLFFGCVPPNYASTDLATLDADISSFDRIDLLSAVAGLQLLAENAERIVRLEALAYPCRVWTIQSI